MTKDRIFTLLSRKLSGEATSAELAELEDVLHHHPEINEPAQIINEFWQIPAEADDDFLEATYHLHTQRLQKQGYDLEISKQETGLLNLEKPAYFFKRKRVLAVLSIAAVIFTILFFKDFKVNTSIAKAKTAISEVSTKNGSRSKLTLPDGSTVWLNSDSKILYDNENFTTNIREVSLSGEAYFDVVKNPAKPFVIHTAKMDIKVLGTAFNVKSYPGDKTTETSLIRGSVEVTLKNRPEKIIMKPNEKLIINNDDIIATATVKNQVTKHQQPIQKANPIIELSHLTFSTKDSSVVESVWVQNRLEFSNETLEEIAIKMERWYGNVSIVIADEVLKKEQLNGIFEKETVYQALDALQLSTPFTYKVNNNVITITK